jgi:quinol monooxygenase YgiN
MYCMIARNQINPGKAAATAKALDKYFVPILKRTPGFRSASMVAGPKGEYTGVIVWDSRAGADAYANNPDRKAAIEANKDLWAGPMKLEFGEVLEYATA